jgi:hypothetical protein
MISHIDRGMSCALPATMRSGGQFMVNAGRSYRALTLGKPDHVDLGLVRVR